MEVLRSNAEVHDLVVVKGGRADLRLDEARGGPAFGRQRLFAKVACRRLEGVEHGRDVGRMEGVNALT